MTEYLHDEKMKHLPQHSSPINVCIKFTSELQLQIFLRHIAQRVNARKWYDLFTWSDDEENETNIHLILTKNHKLEFMTSVMIPL